jgi:uncharacterized protein YndB with AHSA1/START domain
MTNPGTLVLTTPTDRDIAMTRVFDAPRARVFQALTRPDLLKQWFLGPPGWSLPVCEIDLRVGGAYRYVWRHEDGREMGVSGVYQEVSPPERIVSLERFDEPWFPGAGLVSYVLTEHDGKTTLTLTLRLDSKEIRDMVLKTPMKNGVAMGWDRLADVLARLAARA